MMRLIISAFLALLLAACGSTPTTDPNGAPVEGRDGNDGGRVTTVTPDGLQGNKLPEELTRGTLAQREVYFDYDKYEIKAEYKNLVTAHAKFLAKNNNFKMLIQGNTDDRGSREYNVALGQKRADALKKMLILLGARENQVESVSFGKEKPRMEGADEAARAENRRADMLYTGEY